jgi:hypothetical protein
MYTYSIFQMRMREHKNISGSPEEKTEMHKTTDYISRTHADVVRVQKEGTG